MFHSFKLCYITDRRSLEPVPLLTRIFAAIDAGVDMIQIREKDMKTRDLMELARAAIERAAGKTSRILINDRLDVALALGAAGIHLGRQSMPAKSVRAIVGSEFMVGVSCHSPAEAAEAEADGADYILLGPIFVTPSKISFGPPLGLGAIQEAAARLKTPILALGGITLERARPCLEAGARGVAGISLFQNCQSLQDRTRELRLKLASAANRREAQI